MFFISEADTFRQEDPSREKDPALAGWRVANQLNYHGEDAERFKMAVELGFRWADIVPSARTLIDCYKGLLADKDISGGARVEILRGLDNLGDVATGLAFDVRLKIPGAGVLPHGDLKAKLDELEAVKRGFEEQYPQTQSE